jgi:hypothetical protein
VSISDGAKPDEVALWAAIQDGTWPRHAGSALGMHPKRVISLCEKWADRGIYNYGVTADLGWVEPQRPGRGGLT